MTLIQPIFPNVPYHGLYKLVNDFAKVSPTERPVFTLRQRHRTLLAYLITATRLN
jgi:hypothetical protein